MTGDEKGRDGADSISYGTHCPRSADTLGQLPVGDSIAVRDCKKLSPNLHLQGRTCYGEREVEASSCPSEVLIDLDLAATITGVSDSFGTAESRFWSRRQKQEHHDGTASRIGTRYP